MFETEQVLIWFDFFDSNVTDESILFLVSMMSLFTKRSIVAKEKNNCGLRPETRKKIEFNRKESNIWLWKRERAFDTFYKILHT